MKRIVCIILILSLLMAIAITNVSAADFSDVSGHWAKDAIKIWSDRGIISGYDGRFQPDDALTRAQLATILSNLLGLTQKAENIYNDVQKNDWFADAILKCTKEGIIKGDGKKANPNEKITREATMVMLARALKIDSAYSIQRQFLDDTDISGWAKNYVYAMINKGYVNGIGKSAIAPKSSITRAAVVTILNNAIKMYINSQGEYSLDDNFAGIVVLRGNGIKIVTNSKSLSVVIANEYSFTSSQSKRNDGKVIPGNTSGSGGGGTGSSGTTTSGEVYTITFFDKAGSIFDIQKVQKGSSAKISGSPTKSGFVFSGWDADLTNISFNMAVNAKWIKTSEFDNLIAMPAYYGNKGDTIALPLKLSGKVDLCAFDIAITFEPLLLSFVEYKNDDKDVIVNYSKETNTIHLNFLSSKNVSGEIDLCDLVFKLVGESNSRAAVSITTKEVVKLGESKEFITPKYKTVDAEVYIN